MMRRFQPAALFVAGLLLAVPPAMAAGPARPALPVAVAVARLLPEAIRVERTGTLHALRSSRLHSQTEGTVVEVRVREGDAVTAGSLLLRLEDRLLVAELAKLEARRRQAEKDLERLRGLVGRRLASEEELGQAETALEIARADERLGRTRLEFTRVRAPFDGVVSERLVEPGDAVPRYTHLLSMLDPGSLVVGIGLSELLIPRLEEARPRIRIRIDALDGLEIPGRLLRVHPTIDPRSRLGRVEIALVRIPAGARVGQLARVRLELAARPRLVIPFAAVRQDERGSFVFRVTPEGRAERAPVVTGLSLGGRTEVVDGLAEGDQVVVRGLLGLRPGARVEIVERVDAGPGQ